jgi:hypothetical protein
MANDGHRWSSGHDKPVCGCDQAARRGSRLHRRVDTTVTITGWTDARISWPLCRPVDNRRGRPTILLDDQLARAVRHEAAAALRHWWGVVRHEA